MNDFEILYNTITLFYNRDKGRRVVIFETKFPDENIEAGYFVRYLLDSKTVIEYRIARDRCTFLSILSLAIGPHYFTPGDFWDYENSQRFSLEASTDAIEQNLRLLDEFLMS